VDAPHYFPAKQAESHFYSQPSLQKSQALSIQEGVDLQHFQFEMSAVLVTMLCWRWLNVSIGKAFF